VAAAAHATGHWYFGAGEVLRRKKDGNRKQKEPTYENRKKDTTNHGREQYRLCAAMQKFNMQGSDKTIRSKSNMFRANAIVQTSDRNLSQPIQSSQTDQTIQKVKHMNQANKQRSVTHQAKHHVRHGTHGGIKAAWSIGTRALRQVTSPSHLRTKGHRPHPWNGNRSGIGSGFGHANAYQGWKYPVGGFQLRSVYTEQSVEQRVNLATESEIEAETDVLVLDHETYVDQDQGVLEVWSVMEDLLLRVNRLCAVSVAVESDDQVALVLAGFKDGFWEGTDLQLRYAILDTQRYRWSQNGRSGTFVEFLSCRGRDLLLTLTPMTTLSHWPLGDELRSRVAVLLRRFPRQTLSLP
jgi:hypothetical protein